MALQVGCVIGDITHRRYNTANLSRLVHTENLRSSILNDSNEINAKRQQIRLQFLTNHRCDVKIFVKPLESYRKTAMSMQTCT